MKGNKTYWKGLEELNQDPEFVQRAQNEFPEFVSVKENTEAEEKDQTSRRDFLKLMGFSVAAASLVACETPVKKAIPYINKPEEIDPGVADWYATTIAKNGLYASLLVKTREGRPIFIEGNELSPITQGGVSAQISASLLGLYDSSRLKNFQKGGEKISREKADKEIITALKKVSANGGNIRIVSQTILSPSTKAVIKDFASKYSGASVSHVMYDPISATGILKANNGTIPNYDFSKVEVIAGFNADFLGTWISPVEFSKQYATGRKLVAGKKENMSKHYQFETGMTITGASADERIKIKPSEEPYYLIELFKQLGGSGISSGYKVPHADKIKTLATSLKKANGKGLIVSGSNDEAVQLIVTEINKLIGSYGNTIDDQRASLYKQGNDDEMITFVEDLAANDIDAVIFYGANPVYDHPFGDKIKESLKKVSLTVSLADRFDETALSCEYVCPDFHYLESWNDAEPKQGMLSLSQPTISPIFNLAEKGYETRDAQSSFLVWSEQSEDNFYNYLVDFWKKNYFPQSGASSFEDFWNKSVHDGIFHAGSVQSETASFPASSVSDSTSSENDFSSEEEENNTNDESFEGGFIATSSTEGAQKFKYNAATSLSVASKKIKEFYKPENNGFELSLYESVNLGSGDQGNNPWLYETPDPLSKVTWDNYVAMSITDATEMDLLPSGPEKNQVPIVKVTLVGKGSIDLPVLVQPGQAKGTVSIALGYGRTSAGTLTNDDNPSNWIQQRKNKAIGVNLYPFVSTKNSTLSYNSGGVKIEPKGKMYTLAQTQTHQTIMARNTDGGETVIQESILANYKNKDLPKIERTGVVEKKIATSSGLLDPNEVDLWAAPVKEDGEFQEVKTHAYPNHHWGLAIDLNSCTGCSACHVACQVENNIPVVGKDEVIRRRDMHWMRIDRYYSSDAPVEKTIAGFKELEHPSDNPQVTFQPMMCQHCNHAPCETVCPVAATTHSSEGLNQMTYNRCIGTRYCANNCPYKVRRFNWFNYSDSTDEGREFQHVNVTMNSDLGKMVLNPDVTVRARGVMEKCSMCVQRIQAGKLKAKMEKRRVEDGDIITACASVCPTDAIVFGDMNDQNSKITKVLEEENEDRSYHVLGELNVKPNVNYLSKIRNIEE